MSDAEWAFFAPFLIENRRRGGRLEHVAQKWIPDLRNNMRQNNKIEHGFDSIKTRRALAITIEASGHQTASKGRTHDRSLSRSEAELTPLTQRSRPHMTAPFTDSVFAAAFDNATCRSL
jgi:hypothetical protein